MRSTEEVNVCQIQSKQILSWGEPSKSFHQDFPGGTVVKNQPANAGDTGLSPGLGRFHMPRSN